MKESGFTGSSIAFQRIRFNSIVQTYIYYKCINDGNNTQRLWHAIALLLLAACWASLPTAWAEIGELPARTSVTMLTIAEASRQVCVFLAQVMNLLLLSQIQYNQRT